jgi:hypothetical protein
MSLKTSIIAFLYSFLILTTIKAQDTLYYSVENVSEEMDSDNHLRSANNKDLKEFSEGNEKSLKLRKDKYLIPYIISQTSRFTDYHILLPWEEVKNSVKDYRILKIGINVFNNNIEYQIHLYQSSYGSLQLLNIRNFFINPDQPEYANTVNTEIQKLFDGYGSTNRPPVAKIRVDGKLVGGDTTFYRSHLDTILMDGLSSNDQETPKKFLQYTWRVNKIIIGPSTINSDGNAYFSDFKFENPQQKLVIKEPGKYIFSLEVSDGITKSVRDSVSIFISVINKPILELHKSDFLISYQGNLSNYFVKNDRLFKAPDSIGYNIRNFDPSSQLVFKYLNSTDKSRKYFLEIKPGMKENTIFLNYKPGNDTRQIKDTSTVRISGIRIDTSQYRKSGTLYFWLNRKITPGNHKYLMYTDFKGVTSNFDTVTVSFREKSYFYLYGGFEKLTGYKGKDYFRGFSMNIMEYGFRFYITSAFSADVNCMFPERIRDYSNITDQNFGLNFLSGKINFDIPTRKLNLYTGGLPMYFSCSLGTYKLHVFDNNITNAYFQFGGGMKIRAQLFANNPGMGIWYLEAEKYWYSQFTDNPYKTESMGIRLIYGLWRY